MSGTQTLMMGLLAVLLSAGLVFVFNYSTSHSILVSYIVFASIYCIWTIMNDWSKRSDNLNQDADDWAKYSRRHNMLESVRYSTFNSSKTGKPTKLDDSTSISDTADRAFAHWSQLNSTKTKASRQRAFLASTQHSKALDSIKSELSWLGYDIDICNDLGEVLSCISESPDKWKFLFIDIDSLDGINSIEEIVDSLLYFRSETPHIPIALVSEHFERDDLGTTRLHAADISLRSPVSKGRAEQSLPIMIINNNLWKRQDIRLTDKE